MTATHRAAMLAAVGHLYRTEAYPDSLVYVWPPRQRSDADLDEAARLDDVAAEWFALAYAAGWDGKAWPWEDDLPDDPTEYQ